MKLKCYLLALTLSMIGVQSGWSDDGRISGYMFGDYYYVAANHDPSLEDKNGFWFRRVYFTYDQNLNSEFSVRFRLELNSPGDFDTRAKLEPFLKDGYLQWKKAGHAVILGISPTPIWNHVEDVWGYRAVEKTPADLFKFGSSRDLGVAVKGKLGSAEKTSYHFQFGNGSSTSSETNDGKKVALALGQSITDEVTVQVYGDFEERPGRSNRYTAQAFLGCEAEAYRVGAQIIHQTRQQPSGGEEQLQVASVFATARLKAGLWGFARFDRAFDPISDGSSIDYLPVAETAKFNFLLVGVDYQPHEQVHIMPNIEAIFYDSNGGVSPDADVIPRVTFHYIWK